MPKLNILSRLVIKLLNTVSLLQSAAFKMSSVVMPALAAAIVAAPLIECALNVLVSIPLLFLATWPLLIVPLGYVA